MNNRKKPGKIRAKQREFRTRKEYSAQKESSNGKILCRAGKEHLMRLLTKYCDIKTKGKREKAGHRASLKYDF